MRSQDQKNKTHSTGPFDKTRDKSGRGDEKGKLFSEELLEEDFELEKDLENLPI